MYAKSIANCFASEIYSPHLALVRSHDPHVMDFMDISADESTSNTSDDGTSSNSTSTDAISFNQTPSMPCSSAVFHLCLVFGVQSLGMKLLISFLLSSASQMSSKAFSHVNVTNISASTPLLHF